jgi:hypothetical protein
LRLGIPTGRQQVGWICLYGGGEEARAHIDERTGEEVDLAVLGGAGDADIAKQSYRIMEEVVVSAYQRYGRHFTWGAL